MSQDKGQDAGVWCDWIEEAAKAAAAAWTRDRSIRICCTPGGFWIEGRLLVRDLKQEVRVEQLRAYGQFSQANINTLADAVERVIGMLDAQAMSNNLLLLALAERVERGSQ